MSDGVKHFYLEIMVGNTYSVYEEKVDGLDDDAIDVVLASDHDREMAKDSQLQREAYDAIRERDKQIAELRAEVKDLKRHKAKYEADCKRIEYFDDLHEKIARQAREAEVSKAVIEKLNSRLAAFVEYFDAIKNGEYQKNRPFLRDFEEVLLLRGQEVLNELAAIERAEGEKE